MIEFAHSTATDSTVMLYRKASTKPLLIPGGVARAKIGGCSTDTCARLERDGIKLRRGGRTSYSLEQVEMLALRRV
jgi:hypothetical protein